MLALGIDVYQGGETRRKGAIVPAPSHLLGFCRVTRARGEGGNIWHYLQIRFLNFGKSHLLYLFTIAPSPWKICFHPPWCIPITINEAYPRNCVLAQWLKFEMPTGAVCIFLMYEMYQLLSNTYNKLHIICILQGL